MDVNDLKDKISRIHEWFPTHHVATKPIPNENPRFVVALEFKTKEDAEEFVAIIS